MFAKILYPIALPYYVYRCYKHMTPEQKAEMRSATITEERKNEIALQVARTAFPNIEIA